VEHKGSLSYSQQPATRPYPESAESNSQPHASLLQPFRIRPSGLFQFGIKSWNYESFGSTPWTGDRPIARPLPTQVNTTQKCRGKTLVHRLGFENTTPGFERSKIAGPLWSAHLRSILILSFHLRLRIGSGLFSWGVPTEILHLFIISPCVGTATSSHRIR
jgi:hypothetical protein